MSIFIDEKAKISPTAVIYPNNYILGETEISDGCIIYPNCFLKNAKIGKNCVIMSSTIQDSSMDENSNLGPNSHLRNNTKVGKNVRLGNFVEIKNSNIGDETKIAHLTYVGDADIGKSCNLGCGVVFCNYDGVKKHRSNIGNNVFIGSNVNLIAPITVEDDCFIAAGSTVNQSMQKNTFAIARAKQVNKPKR